MSLSPIQIFQQQQNPLAQILAGGNETITGIFDKAIQIGRDMSNKQLQQEQDMMSMRNAETNMAQRRAENLQQNNEDAIKFARGAFESDRKFGVDQTQQSFQNNRVTAQALFSNTDTATRTGLLGEANTRANADQTRQVEIYETSKKREEAALSYDRLLSSKLDSETSAPNEGGSLVSQVFPTQTGDASMISQDQYREAAGALNQREVEANRLAQSKDPSIAAKGKARLAELQPEKDILSARFKQSFKSGNPPDPELQKLQQLKVDEAEEAAKIKTIRSAMKTSPDAYPDSFGDSKGFVESEAVRLGVKSDEVIYKKEFGKESGKEHSDENINLYRNRYKESLTASQDSIEYGAIKESATEDDYVKKFPTANPAQQQARRQLYREITGAGKGTTTTPGASKELTPQEKAEADAQAFLDS